MVVVGHLLLLNKLNQTSDELLACLIYSQLSKLWTVTLSILVVMEAGHITHLNTSINQADLSSSLIIDIHPAQ